jgi:hypothetical protein
MTDTIVLGLDDATWNITETPLENGRLPKLASLVSKGQSCTLEGTLTLRK